jgi:hypothetical protein
VERKNSYHLVDATLEASFLVQSDGVLTSKLNDIIIMLIGSSPDRSGILFSVSKKDRAKSRKSS